MKLKFLLHSVAGRLARRKAADRELRRLRAQPKKQTRGVRSDSTKSNVVHATFDCRECNERNKLDLDQHTGDRVCLRCGVCNHAAVGSAEMCDLPIGLSRTRSGTYRRAVHIRERLGLWRGDIGRPIPQRVWSRLREVHRSIGAPKQIDKDGIKRILAIGSISTRIYLEKWLTIKEGLTKIKRKPPSFDLEQAVYNWFLDIDSVWLDPRVQAVTNRKSMISFDFCFVMLILKYGYSSWLQHKDQFKQVSDRKWWELMGVWWVMNEVLGWMVVIPAEPID